MPTYPIQFRRDTPENWQSANPVLRQGEMGIELPGTVGENDVETFKYKIGDGVRAWNDLPYASGPAGPSPEYEWNGTSIRFKNPNGTWGEYIDIQGPQGIKGETGDPGPAGTATPATTTTIGGVIVGNGLEITPEGCLSVSGANILYKLGDGELNLYVRPDGSDSNDGTANTPESAWATIEHAVAWISERRFTGGGLVTVNIADGTYTPGVSALNNGGQFPNPFTTYKSIPDVINPTDCERWRVRLVGNLSSPSSVVISIDPNYDSFYISNMKVCGVTFVKSGTPSVSVDSVVGIVSGCLANVRIVVGIPSPYYVLRVDNSNLYGSIEINAQSSVAVKNELLTFYGQNSLIGCYSIALNSLNPGQRPAYISLTGTTMSASYTVSVAQGNKLIILSGGGSGASSGNSTFTGSISASRYYVAFPSVIYSNGLGVNFFPGTSAGAASMPSSLYL